eukprot:scaffold137954_cov31-Tisochrysis_lutea.AAC.2
MTLPLSKAVHKLAAARCWRSVRCESAAAAGLSAPLAMVTALVSFGQLDPPEGLPAEHFPPPLVLVLSGTSCIL